MLISSASTSTPMDRSEFLRFHPSILNRHIDDRDASRDRTEAAFKALSLISANDDHRSRRQTHEFVIQNGGHPSGSPTSVTADTSSIGRAPNPIRNRMLALLANSPPPRDALNVPTARAAMFPMSRAKSARMQETGPRTARSIGAANEIYNREAGDRPLQLPVHDTRRCPRRMQNAASGQW